MRTLSQATGKIKRGKSPENINDLERLLTNYFKNWRVVQHLVIQHSYFCSINIILIYRINIVATNRDIDATYTVSSNLVGMN